MLIASSSDVVKFHSWPHGAFINSYKPKTREGPIQSISWSKDGTWMVLVPAKGCAEVITLKENIKFLHAIQGVQLPTCAVFQNTTKKMIALGTISGQVLIYDMKSKSIKKRLQTGCSAITKVAFNSKDTHVFGACASGEVLLYNTGFCVLSSSFKIPNSRSVSCLRCHQSNLNYVAAGSEEGIIAAWDINAKRANGHLQAHAAPVVDLVFSPIRSDFLVSVGMDRYCTFYDTNSNKPVTKFATEKTPTAVDLTPDGIDIAISNTEGVIFQYDTRNMKEPKNFFQAHHGYIESALFQKVAAEEKIGHIQADKSEVVMRDSIDSAKSGYDSFGPMLSGVNSGTNLGVTNEKPTLEDSFLAALGISGGDSPSIVNGGESRLKVIQQEDGKKKTITPNKPPTLLEAPSHKHLATSLQKTPSKKDQSMTLIVTTPNIQTINPPPAEGERSSSAATSTPLLSNQVLESNISPILDNNENPLQSNGNEAGALINQDQIRSIIREELRSVVQEEFEKIKTDLRYEIMDNCISIQRQLFSMQFQMNKQYHQQEDFFTKLRRDIVFDDEL